MNDTLGSHLPRVMIALGGNLGDVLTTFSETLDQFASRGVQIVAVSRAYRTEPWVLPDHTGPLPPPYWNAVCEVRTQLQPHALLELLLRLEQHAGRARHVRWAARTLDLDLLLYGACVIDTPTLRLPHPELLRRPFVLLPLHDIDPMVCIPPANNPVHVHCAAITAATQSTGILEIKNTWYSPATRAR